MELVTRFSNRLEILRMAGLQVACSFLSRCVGAVFNGVRQSGSDSDPRARYTPGRPRLDKAVSSDESRRPVIGLQNNPGSL